jgi:hypothetical protein
LSSSDDFEIGSRHIIFLDADDRLLPIAIEAGLASIAARSDCAFVYGGHRSISEHGEASGPDYVTLIEGDAHLGMLRGNQIAMHAAVLYRCDCLLETNGFDETLAVCEDYDLYSHYAEIRHRSPSTGCC